METIDLYDRSGRPLGKTVPKGQARPPEAYYRHVHVILCDRQNQYLIQQRAFCQKYLPGKWDVTGGGVRAGETSLTAAIREVGEELGLALRPEDLHLAGSRVDEAAGRCLLDIYCAKLDVTSEDCVLQKEEVEAVRLVDFDTFVKTVCYNKDQVYRELLGKARVLLEGIS